MLTSFFSSFSVSEDSAEAGTALLRNFSISKGGGITITRSKVDSIFTYDP